MYRESAEAKKIRGQKLRASVIKAGYKPAELADKLGVHKNTMYRWFRDPSSIFVTQVDQIISTLRVTDSEMKEIFLPQYARLS